MANSEHTVLAWFPVDERAPPGLALAEYAGVFRSIDRRAG